METNNKQKILKLAEEIEQRVERIKSLIKETSRVRPARKTHIPMEKKRKVSKGGKNIMPTLNLMLAAGFFKEPRALIDIKDELHRRVVIVPLTTLPNYMNRMVQDGRLERHKASRGKRKVWVYKTKKK